MAPLHQDLVFENPESDHFSTTAFGPQSMQIAHGIKSRPSVCFQSTIEVIGTHEDTPNYVRWYSPFDYLRFREDRDAEAARIMQEMDKREENIAVAGAVTVLCIFEQSYSSNYAHRRLIHDLAEFVNKGFPTGLEKKIVRELYSEFLSSRRQSALEYATAIGTTGGKELILLRKTYKEITIPSVLFAHCTALALEGAHQR